MLAKLSSLLSLVTGFGFSMIRGLLFGLVGRHWPSADDD